MNPRNIWEIELIGYGERLDGGGGGEGCQREV